MDSNRRLDSRESSPQRPHEAEMIVGRGVSVREVDGFGARNGGGGGGGLRGTFARNHSAYKPQSGLTNDSTIATEMSVYDPIDQLFHLVDSAIQVEDPEYSYEERWNRVREWLDLHADVNERAEAACRLYFNQYLNHKDSATEHMAVLHMVCYHPSPPLDIVQSLLECSADVVSQMDNLERTPLSYACMSSTNVEVVEMLVESYPEAVHLMDNHGNTPLFYLINKAKTVRMQDARALFKEEEDVQVLENMMEVFDVLCRENVAEEMLSQPTPMLPLHLACALGVPPPVLSILVEANAAAVTEPDNNGRTPMHYIMSNINATSDEAIHILTSVQRETVNLDDAHSDLPLHSLSEAYSGKRADTLDQRSKDDAVACLVAYLDAKPRATPRFLNELQQLPPFLKDDAMIHEHVKAVLNRKITEKVPFAFFLTDLYMYMVAIFCLHLAARDYLDDKECTKTAKLEVWCLLVVGIYFVMREIMQVISLITLGIFQNWYHDVMNYLDVSFIILILILTVKMLACEDHKAYDDKAEFRILSVITTSLLFVILISYIRSFFLTFSVFINGVIYVVKSLRAFLIALCVFLIAFSEIFYFLFYDSEECLKDIEINPHCRLTYSGVRIIASIMGEIDPVNYEEPYEANIFFSLYIFVVIILLSNVLIAIVTDNYSVIRDERADIVFWADRLDFVSEIYAINRLGRLFRCCGHGADDEFEEHNDATWDRAVWKDLHNFLFGNDNLGDDIVNTQTVPERVLVTVYQLVALLIVLPVWILVGVASAGWAWPPQWRERLLAHNTTLVSKNIVNVQVSKQIAELKKEVNDLREEAKREMKNDRNELISMKAEAESLQRDVLEDMVQIKEIMNSLLDMARSKV